MKSISLLLLRFSTGSYLMLWGLLKLAKPDAAQGVSQKYYGGLLDAAIINYGLGGLQLLVGLLVVLGLLRSIVYPAQAAFYLLGLLAITPYIVDPFGLYWANSAKLTFYPSTTLFFACLVMLAFKAEDSLSLDARRQL